MEKKRGKTAGYKTCLNCKKRINLKTDKYTFISTCKRETMPDHHAYFHWTCWKDYFDQRVLMKSKETIQQMQQQAIQMFNNPLIQNLFSQFQGSELFEDILKTPMSSPVVIISKNKVEDKIENDRRKKGKERKLQMHKV
jgi:hypothetical protein